MFIVGKEFFEQGMKDESVSWYQQKRIGIQTTGILFITITTAKENDKSMNVYI